MQIEVVDDHSVDDPSFIADTLGDGRVGYYRQTKNVGYIANFETCLARSRGHLIHLLHGDDLVRDGFYHKMQQAFDRNPKIGAAFCRHILMDEQGHWQIITWLEQTQSGTLTNWLERIAVENRIQAPSIVVRREVYERLGGFDRRISCCGEDWEMWIRIAAEYPVWYEVEPLAMYRVHATSLTGRSARSGADTRSLRTALEIVQAYLPEYQPAPVARDLLRQARETVALAALRSAVRMLYAGDTQAAIAQAGEAIQCSTSWRVVAHLNIFVARLAARLARETAHRSAEVARGDPWSVHA